MSSLKPIPLKLSAFHRQLLSQLCRRKGLDRTNIIRLAIVEMAEREGLTARQNGESKHG